MAKRRPEPSPLARTQEAWLWAAACLALALHAPYAPAWLSVLAALALAWRAECWHRKRPLPPRWLVTLLALAAAVAVFAHYRTVFGRDPGVALLIVLLALKLLEMRGPRDGWVVALLGYFLVFSLFFHSQAPPAAAVATAVLVVITAALASLSHAGRPMAANLRLAALVIAQSLPFMLAMFLLFPRVQGPLWGLPADAFGARSGLSDTMTPGSISQLSLSDDVAFRAKFDGNPPPPSRLYWRGPVLNRYDGRTWRTARATVPIAAPQAPPRSGSVYDYSITLEPHNRNWLFALELPVRYSADGVMSDDYQLLARAAVRARLRYELRSITTLKLGAEEAAATLRENLQLPPDSNPRARALGARWRQELGDDEAIVRQMLAYYRKQFFIYTLRPPLLGEHNVDEFLFDVRRGFCEHYAGSFVFVMRAAGIPARVVTGYQGGEINPLDGYMIVRQSDAHAWAEVWLKGQGWVRVDPTGAVAPTRIESGIAAAVQRGEPLPFLVRGDLSWLRDLHLRWEAVSNAWNQWVLGYNPLRQRELLSRLGMGQPDWQSMTGTLAALCGLLVLAMIPWALRQRQRLDPALRSWNALSRKLARRGLARQAWEGPRDYARRVSAALPRQHDEIERIAALYVRLRYGGGSDAQALQELKTRVSRFYISSSE